MRIAQIAPLTEAIPPKLYGGTERVISWLTEELVALGHDVTLFASGDSVTTPNLRRDWPRALRLDGNVRDPIALHMTMLERVRQRAAEFDMLHFHLDYYPFSIFSRQSTPFVTTLHGRLDLPEHQPVFDLLPSPGGIHFELSTQAGAAGPLGRAPFTMACPSAADVRKPGQAVLSCVPRPHLARKGDRPRHPDRRRCGLPIKIAAKVDKRRSGLFRRARSDRCSICRAWSISARSATPRSRTS